MNSFNTVVNKQRNASSCISVYTDRMKRLPLSDVNFSRKSCRTFMFRSRRSVESYTLDYKGMFLWFVYKSVSLSFGTIEIGTIVVIINFDFHIFQEKRG